METKIASFVRGMYQRSEKTEVKYVVKFLYSKIPILRPPLGLPKSGLKDHFWIVPKVVFNQRDTGCRK